METPTKSQGSPLGKQLKGIIIILVILVLNAAVTLLILSNRTAKMSETDKISFKEEILNEVETLIERKNENPSQICLEGDEDCNDTVDETCLVGSEDCGDAAIDQTCLVGTPGCNDTPEVTPTLLGN